MSNKLVLSSRKVNMLQEKAQDFLFFLDGQDFFTCKLYALFQKADMHNRKRLSQAYPEEGIVFEKWLQEGKKGVKQLAEGE